MSRDEGIANALEAALRYIEFVGSNVTATGAPHPQALLIEQINAQLDVLKPERIKAREEAALARQERQAEIDKPLSIQGVALLDELEDSDGLPTDTALFYYGQTILEEVGLKGYISYRTYANGEHVELTDAGRKALMDLKC